MVKTIEDLDREYEGREADENWFIQQSALGSQEDALEADDSEGDFHCINWFDCVCCPAASPECFF